MKIGVIGVGRWGTFLAYYFNKIGHEVFLYGREGSKNFKELCENRGNEYINDIGDIKLTSNLEEVSTKVDLIVVSINSQGFRSFLRELKEIKNPCTKLLIAMKGLELNTGKRLSVVCKEEFPLISEVAVIVGPGHVQTYINEIPTCMIISCENEEYGFNLTKELSSKLLRLYFSNDLIGCEIGAAAKNVIGIAAGILDGLNMSGLKGALMARGAKEVSRYIEHEGGNSETAYGLSHLGDYEATLFSEYSNNRLFGENLIKSIETKKLAEGYYTVSAMHAYSIENNIYSPIINALYRILYEGIDALKEINNIFDKVVKWE